MSVASPGLSEHEAAAFAAIVQSLGDPERRRFRGVALGSASGFLVVAVAVQLSVLRWPWAAVVSFAVTSVVGLATGLVLVARFFVPRPK